MITVRDFKGNVYNVLEAGAETTLLECSQKGDRVRIRSWGWDEIGFIRP